MLDLFWWPWAAFIFASVMHPAAFGRLLFYPVSGSNKNRYGDKSDFCISHSSGILKQFIKEVRVGRDYNIEIVLNVPLDEFEEFKRHAASAGRGKKQKNKSQNPQKVGRCTSNAGIVVLDKTAGETISIVPENAAHAILHCQDEWCTILQRTAKRNAVSFNTIRHFMDSKGVEPSTFRMRTERSPSNIAFAHTLCTARKEKSTYIRLYKMPCQPNGLSWL